MYCVMAKNYNTYCKKVCKVNFNGCYFLSFFGLPFASWIPIFFCVKIVCVFVTFDNIFSLMIKALLDFFGLRLKELQAKLIDMGYDDNLL